MIRTNVQTFAVAIFLIAAAGCSGGGGSGSSGPPPPPAGGGQSTPNPGASTSASAFKQLQACFPVTEDTNCNSNANPAATAPPKAYLLHGYTVQLLVADDASYATGSTAVPALCSSSTACGGYTVDTSAGSCQISNVETAQVDIPTGTPAYKDAGPMDQLPIATTPVTRAVFPAVGPYTEFDIIVGAAGTTCDVSVTETDASSTVARTVRLQVPVN